VAEPDGDHGEADNLRNICLKIGVAVSSLHVHANVLVCELLRVTITINIQDNFLLFFVSIFVFLLAENFVDSLGNWRVFLIYHVHAR